MKVITAIFLVLFLIGGILIYVASVSFAEHREYKLSSADYWILTPEPIAQITKYCQDEPGFTYSAADGPKPTITTLNCTIAEDEFFIFLNKNFSKVSDSVFKNGNQEIAITKGPANKITSISMLQFL